MFKIVNMKVDSPSCIWGRVVRDDVHSSTQYNTLLSEMNLFYSDVHQDWQKLVPSTIEEGQMFIVYWSCIKSWCRAKIEAVIHDTVPIQACCFLVDHGERICVPKDKIRIGLKKFLQLPFWVRRFHLSRIKPMKLHVSPCEELAELIPSSQWDSSASLYLHRLLQASTLIEAVLLVKESESTAIELYMTIDSFKICVNDDLVAKRFANYRRQPTDNCLLDKKDRTPLMLSPNILNQTGRKPALKPLERTPPCPGNGKILWSRCRCLCHDLYLSLVASQSLHETLNGDGPQSNLVIPDNKSNNRLLNGSDEGELSKTTEGHWPPLGLPSMYTSESDLSEDSSSTSAVNENLMSIRSSGHVDLGNGDQQTASVDNLELTDHHPEKTTGNLTVFSGSDFGRQESLAAPKPLNKEARVCQSFLMWLNPKLLKSGLDEESSTLPPVDPMRNEILVHSALPPLEPCTSLDDMHLTKALCWELKKRRHPTLSPSESHSWPAILQGCNTLIISSNADDLLTCIPPLLQHILLNSMYCTQITGPIAVVLCPRWERVQMVGDLLNDLNVSRVLNAATVLLGHRKDEAEELRIPQNCLFLVTTPFSLVRLLGSHFSLFLNVYHLILDEADQLFTHAAVQMTTILQHFKKIPSNEENHDCPHQLVATSKKWTNEMEDLVASYMTHPSIIISSPEEAAFYGEVHQMVRVTLESSKTAVLLGSLDFSPDVGQKTLIIANSPKEAEDVFEAVRSKSAFSLKLHEGLTDQVEEALLHWRKDISPGSHILLVTTDECLKCLDIRDATCVIHYSFPTSPKCFGRRLFCMADNFRNLSRVGAEQKEARPKGCPPAIRSLVLISERNARHVTGIVRYMKRTNALLPPELLTFAEAIQVVQEERKSSLCSSLKSWGFCSNTSKCLDRHKFDSRLDASELPSSGIIEVVPLHVQTASVYYGRILSGDTDFERMMSELASYYSEKSMGMVQEVLEGGLYAVEENDSFHRVKVLSVPDRGSQLFFSVLAEFIDVGKKEEVRSHQLLPLPERFHSLPSQAVEIVLCRLKPIDAETQWHPKVTRAISEKIEGLQHKARAVLALGKTVFVDCMVRVTKLPGMKTQINEHNVKSLILNTGMGEKNPQHLDVLQALCRKDPEGVESGNLFESTNGHVCQGDLTNTEDEVLLKALQVAQLDELAGMGDTNSKADVTNSPESAEPPSHGDCYLESSENQAPPSHSPTPFLSHDSKEEMSSCQNNGFPSIQKAVCQEPRVPLLLTPVENKDLPQSLHPQVHWYQTLDSVIMTVKLIAPEKQKCGFFPDKVVYSGQVNGHLYRADLQLQGSIIADRCSWQMKSNEPVLKLVKLQSGRWDRLVKSKNIFVTYDMAHLDEEEYDEVEKRNDMEQHRTSDFCFFGETGEENWNMSSDSGSESD
ncbi:LOW QUALITY PROTEIN: putative ATP-dependent RNA helicase TDRD12 [Neosynchiropus ocellatus]